MRAPITTTSQERLVTAPDIPHAEHKLGTVAVLYTKPETVLSDYADLMDLAGYQDSLTPNIETSSKSTSPGSTTTPPAQLPRGRSKA